MYFLDYLYFLVLLVLVINIFPFAKLKKSVYVWQSEKKRDKVKQNESFELKQRVKV